jgi:hypothetical protein
MTHTKFIFCINIISYSLLEFSDSMKAIFKLSLVLNEIFNVLTKFFLSFSLYLILST